MITSEQIRTMTDVTVTDRQGVACGTAGDVYVDDADTPRWLVVHMGGQGGAAGDECLAPLEGAELMDEGLRLACSSDQLMSAPRITAEDEIGIEDERALMRHFHVEGAMPGDGGTSDTELPEYTDTTHLHLLS